jgi:glutaredoxin
MRNTHTHKGHCQACGRVQAVSTDDNSLAKHGYDVQFGFFNGTCSGSDKEPLEVSKRFSEVTISKMKNAIEEKREEIETFTGVTQMPVVFTTRNMWGKEISKVIKQIGLASYTKLKDYEEVQMIDVASLGDVIETNRCVYDKGEYKKYDRSKVERLVEKQNKIWIRETNELISYAINHIAFLQDLIERVHGNDLINVADSKKILEDMESEVLEGFYDYQMVKNRLGTETRDYLAGYEKSITRSVSVGDITLKITRQQNYYRPHKDTHRCAFSLNGKKIAKNKLLETMGVA